MVAEALPFCYFCWRAPLGEKARKCFTCVLSAQQNQGEPFFAALFGLKNAMPGPIEWVKIGLKKQFAVVVQARLRTKGQTTAFLLTKKSKIFVSKIFAPFQAPSLA